MAYAPLTKIPQQFFDNLGNPLVSGTLYAYLAGTSTPTNMFSDNAGTVAGTSVVLDSRGEPTTFKLIWLNTAVIYKFVLKDSTGTTIWTIDNISGDDGTGAGSASTVFDQQTLTATAGQTLFNLGYEYVTGTNAMAVYKNGSRLITGIDFTETSSTSVTLTMAAIAGDEYTFIGGQDVSSSFSSSNVSFIQSGTGAVTRSVQTKLRETVSVKDFGATGNGVADDTAEIQAAIDAVSSAGGGTVFLPEGTYITSSRIQPKSNVHLVGEGLGTKIICSGYQAILASRDDAPNNTTPHTNIRLFNFYVESAWRGASPTHANDSSCVELEFCDDCVIDSVYVGKADDSCIRVSGYRKGIASFTPSFTNPDFGFAKRNRIVNCTAIDGYLGIELVGGAQCDVIGNTVKDSYFHGIRLAGGGWECSVENNRVMTCQHTALYIEYCKELIVADNPYLRSDRSPQTGCSIGVGEDISIESNNFVGVVVDTILPGVCNKLIVSGNNITGGLDFREATNVKAFGNYVTGDARIEGPATGEMYDNLVGTLTVDANDMVQAGGLISYRNNLLISSKLPAAPTTQASVLGTASAVPSAGTFRAGDIILKANATDYAGWICTAAGTPGTWQPFGLIDSNYTKQITGHNNGTNQTRTILSLTVPNASHAIRLVVNLFLSRSPASAPGQSRVIRNEITIVRQAGSNCVIDTALATGNYEVQTTTAGGATSPSASSLTATIASGGVTDPQVINVTAFFGTSLTYGTWTIDVQSTSVVSTFGL